MLLNLLFKCFPTSWGMLTLKTRCSQTFLMEWRLCLVESQERPPPSLFGMSCPHLWGCTGGCWYWVALKYVVVNYNVFSLLFGEFLWDSYNEWVFGRFLELSSFSLFRIVWLWWVSDGHHCGHHHQRRHPAPQHRCQHGQNLNVNLIYSRNCKLIRVKLSPIKQVYSASQFTLSRSTSQNFSGQV